MVGELKIKKLKYTFVILTFTEFYMVVSFFVLKVRFFVLKIRLRVWVVAGGLQSVLGFPITVSFPEMTLYYKY